MFQDLDSTLTKILDDPAMNAPPLAPPLAELLGAEVSFIKPNKNGGEFWDPLAIPLRPAFYLTVTIAMDLGMQDTGPLVTTRLTSVTPGDGAAAETIIQIGGKVLAPQGAALRGASTP